MPFLSRFKLRTRRVFRLMLPAIAVLSLCLALLTGMQPKTVSAHAAPVVVATSETASFQVSPLPYAYDALAPYIDAQTMRLHHDKHHQAYVTGLNAAIAKHPDLKNKTAEELIQHLDLIPEDIRISVRNYAGGHLNHSIFWQTMAPNHGGVPTGDIAAAINQTFGSFDTFKQKFNEVGMKRFGSGWVWLVRTRDGKLALTSTANQDSPLLENQYPLLGNDMWEHAYYLTYQNRRADYLNAWWNVVNWDQVNQRLMQAK